VGELALTSIGLPLFCSESRNYWRRRSFCDTTHHTQSQHNNCCTESLLHSRLFRVVNCCSSIIDLLSVRVATNYTGRGGTHGLGLAGKRCLGPRPSRDTGGEPKASKAVCVTKSTDNVLCYAPSRPRPRERGDAS